MFVLHVSASVHIVIVVVVIVVIVVMVACVAREDVSSVSEFGIGASEDVSAGTNHVFSEGELLAVEHEEISVNIKLVLAASASLLQPLNPVLLVINFIVIV